MTKSVDNWVLQMDTLLIANRAQLRRAAYKILSDWDRADDVIQDAYLKIRDYSSNKSEIRQPLAYLFQMVRNMAIDQYRRIALEMELFGGDKAGLLVPDTVRTPEACVMYAQHLELVVTALNKLPERTQRVFERYRIDGYTHRMIAEELNISVSLVNILIHEAIRQCRKSLSNRSVHDTH
ncbi:MAG: sigma-70 family RNA polymerase sigma factor [Nitrosomonas sp.]|nr:sigma-70 family RNA polymerase sigma factor [Nitrosomonas sp.]MCW5606854.1 sigma-70 family RNA polymerase sigma factor [Nitrosomonas sp.]